MPKGQINRFERKDATDVAFFYGRDINELRADMRKLAKRANQRLVRIEQAGEQKHSMAYQKAQSWLIGKKISKTGKYRFTEFTKNVSKKQIIEEMQAMQEFLSLKSSTVGEIHDYMRSSYRIFLQNHPQLAGIMTPELYKTFFTMFGKERTKNIYYNELMDIMEELALSNMTEEQMIEWVKEAGSSLIRSKQRATDMGVKFDQRQALYSAPELIGTIHDGGFNDKNRKHFQ